MRPFGCMPASGSWRWGLGQVRDTANVLRRYDDTRRNRYRVGGKEAPRLIVF